MTAPLQVEERHRQLALEVANRTLAGSTAEGLEASELEAIADWIARREAAVTEAVEWKPIETAPQDGTTVLLWGPHMRMGMSTWFWAEEDGIGGWRQDDGKHEDRPLRGPYPTHWKPLPDPPAQPPEGGQEER